MSELIICFTRHFSYTFSNKLVLFFISYNVGTLKNRGKSPILILFFYAISGLNFRQMALFGTNHSTRPTRMDRVARSTKELLNIVDNLAEKILTSFSWSRIYTPQKQEEAYISYFRSICPI